MNLMNIQTIFITALAGLSACASPLPEKADILSSNTVVAQYVGTYYHPCRHMTALCPDRCDHATTLAHFRVLRNERYQRNSEYGDDMMKADDTVTVDVLNDTPGQDEAVVQLISQLKPLDTVRMTIHHCYVQQSQNFFPIRPVVQMEKFRE